MSIFRRHRKHDDDNEDQIELQRTTRDLQKIAFHLQVTAEELKEYVLVLQSKEETEKQKGVN